MNKQYLLAILEKYYLDGLIERIELNINDEIITTKFVNSNKDLVGVVEAPGFKLKNNTLGIFETSQLLKLIGVTNQFVTLDTESKGGISKKLLIADDQYNLEFVLADTNLIPTAPEVEDIEFNINFPVDIEFINKFIKAQKALNTEIINLNTEFIDSVPSIKFNLGGTKGYTNKVNFALAVEDIGIPGTSLNFKIKEIKEILSANKDLETGKGYLNEEGMLKFEFVSTEKIKSTYYLVAKED